MTIFEFQKGNESKKDPYPFPTNTRFFRRFPYLLVGVHKDAIGLRPLAITIVVKMDSLSRHSPSLFGPSSIRPRDKTLSQKIQKRSTNETLANPDLLSDSTDLARILCQCLRSEQ